ncbi:MAG: 2-oxoisovalerate dehydrogenase [Acidobacteriota bacterium]|nr:2-oxoisovalerate dehydrogenase [Acidobacteriota bacterium]
MRIEATAAKDGLIFLVEDAPEGGYTARPVGASIFKEADDIEGLREQVRDAVRCHFDGEPTPHTIRFSQTGVLEQGS